MNNSADQEPESDSGSNEFVSLLFETSPFGNVDALVQHDGRAVYFYLNSPDTFGARACWVRNLKPGPYVVNTDEMKAGIAPMLPRTHCKYSDGRSIPNIDSLEIVWFEEGNGAALLEGDNLLAVIPPWSGMEGFHGYAEECAAESQLCWPMPDNSQLRKRVDRALEFWIQFRSAENNPFVDLQPTILDLFRKSFGQESAYYSIDGGKFPPRGMARFQNGNRITLATVGMCLCPQPTVELYIDNPSELRRIELGLQMDIGDRPLDPETLVPLMEQLSGLASRPWSQWTWFGPGHTCGLSQLAPFLGDEFESAVLLHKNFPDQNSPVSFREDAVNVLWLVPITKVEQQKLESGDAKPEEFSDRISVG